MLKKISEHGEEAAGVFILFFMCLLAFAGLFSWTGSTLGVMDKAAAGLLSLSSNPTVILLSINVMLFVAGMLMDAISFCGYYGGSPAGSHLFPRPVHLSAGLFRAQIWRRI